MYMTEDYHDGDYFEYKDVLNSLRDVCESVRDLELTTISLSLDMPNPVFVMFHHLVRDELMELEESIERFS